MALLLAAALFAVFGANVVAGAFLGEPFFGVIVEMLILFAAAIAFVVAILKRESAQGRHQTTKKTEPQGGQ